MNKTDIIKLLEKIMIRFAIIIIIKYQPIYALRGSQLISKTNSLFNFHLCHSHIPTQMCCLTSSRWLRVRVTYFSIDIANYYPLIKEFTNVICFKFRFFIIFLYLLLFLCFN